MDPQVVFVRGDSPFQDLTDVVEAAKADPNSVRFGVTTPGSLDRQVMEKFRAVTGVTSPVITHDGGGDLLVSVLNGAVSVAIGEIQELASQIEAGEVRVITTYTAERLDTFPDVPTAQEQGIDLTVNKFRGIAGPRGLPDDVMQLWLEGVNKTLANPEFKAWYEAQALVPTVIPPGEYDQFLADFAEEQRAFLVEYGIITN
jgi:tripartite-type tricarboxylate transporter receptor subunit TctC